MRSLLLFALIAMAMGLATASLVAPDAAVMDAPQFDTALIQANEQSQNETAAAATPIPCQMQGDEQAWLMCCVPPCAVCAVHSTAVSELEAEVAASEANEAALAAQAAAQTASNTDSETDSDADSASVEALEAEAEAAAAVEVEAEDSIEADQHSHLEAGAEVDAEAETEVEAEAEIEAETETEAEAEAETEVEAESQVEAEVEAEAEAEAESTTEAEAESESAAAVDSSSEDAQEVSGQATDNASSGAVNAVAKAKKSKKAAAPAPKRRQWGQKEVHSVMRSDPNNTPDVVTLKKHNGKPGKKLYKSWVVDPNVKMVAPAPKPVLKHSKERVMNQEQTKYFSRFAKLKSPRGVSEIRKAFLRLNPAQREQKLRTRAFSPAASLYRAYKQGQFPAIRFDAPSFSSSTVTQHLTIRQHAPSVRQRAEVSALRAATKTLRKINSKAREFKRALKALRKARAGVQRQIHRHHVIRAVQAKKVAARAARRAAWSTLLQHGALRRALNRTITAALRKGQLTGDARRQAIIALLKQNLSPKERARLHKFINGAVRSHRHRARGARHAARRLRRRGGKRAVKVPAGSNAAADQAAAATEADRILDAVGASASVQASAPRAASKSNRARARVTPLRVQASAPKAASKSGNAQARGTPRVRVGASAPKAAVKNGRANKRGKANGPRFAQVHTSVQAELKSAEALAAEAEAEALHQLDVETEVDSPEDLLMLTRAQVEAAAETTDDFIHEHTVEQ